MNLQNIPRDQKDVKSCFVPKLDAFLFFDYKNIEVRVLAFFLSASEVDDDRMAEQFRTNPNYDPHRESASIIFRVPEDEVTDEQRQQAKTFNFAIQYGAQAGKIRHTLFDCSYAQAVQYVKNYHAARPGLNKLADLLAEAQAKNGGYITNLYGRRGYVREKHKLVNWLVQSTSADMMKRAMIEVDDYLELEAPPWADLSSHMVNTVHDELILDVKMDEIPILVRDIPRIMVDPQVAEVVPIEVDTAVSFSTWANKVDYQEYLARREVWS